MTESQWAVCSDPGRMLEHLGPSASSRKLRLFACACCRQPELFSCLSGKDAAAVAIAERFSDSRADPSELTEGRSGTLSLGAVWCCSGWPSRGARLWIDAVRRAWADPGPHEVLTAKLLRGLFGNPFRTVAVTAGWLSWHNGVVANLARAAYADLCRSDAPMSNTRLAVLADALEEAGCDDTNLLSHLRGPGPHVRGCFVVDLLTGAS